MTGFVKFPSIESFAHVWKYMTRKMDPQPMFYGAKVKLHGTNGGVRVNADGSVVAQSRSRDLSAEDDNYGFAKWVAQNAHNFRINPQIMQGADGAEDIKHVTYFGEWAGNGIQNKDAVTQLSNKFFFIFAMQINDTIYTDPAQIEGTLSPDSDKVLVLPWHFVFEAPFDWIDTGTANVLVEVINHHVERIGERDPFIYEVFGIDGPGEGLVLTPFTGTDGIDRDLYSALTFKAKSEAHRVKATEKAVSTRMEIPAEATAFVEMFVTDARCQQALTESCDGIAEKPRTSDFLKWLGGDVRKESLTELRESGLEWKQVAAMVNKAAARWFIQRCEAI